MKSLRQNFTKNVNFVKPLYRKVKCNKIGHKKKDFVSVTIDRTTKLDGYDNDIVKYNKYKRNIPKFDLKTCIESSDKNINNKLRTTKIPISDECKRFVKNMLVLGENTLKGNEEEEVQTQPTIIHKIPDSWLRVYPDTKLPEESICSVIVRCFLCQVGIGSFLILWTLLFVWVIYYFEGPHEIKVTEMFENEQNQLIIDLATELRQITPISDKWRDAIEARIQDERELTILAVGNGARAHPGHFWDLAGTFLFTVYVMTALGFGAPVPHTMRGRYCTLLYAAFAVPAHIYLMVNASTAVVVHMEHFFTNFKICLQEKLPFVSGPIIENNRDSLRGSADCSRNSELAKPINSRFRKKIVCVMGVLCVGRCVPLATLLYYIFGVVSFGVCRNKVPMESIMFPLEFTTTGGLEHVASIVRVTYALYVEGAMCLLAGALATLRRHSGAALAHASRHYRLFDTERHAE